MPSAKWQPTGTRGKVRSQILSIPSHRKVYICTYLYSNTHIDTERHDEERQPPANFVKRTCKIKSRLDSISMSSKLVGHFTGRAVYVLQRGRQGSNSGSGSDSDADSRPGSAYEVRAGSWTPKRSILSLFWPHKITKPEPENGFTEMESPLLRDFKGTTLRGKCTGIFGDCKQ